MLNALEDAGHSVFLVIIDQKIDVPDAIAIGEGVNKASAKSPAAKQLADLFAWLSEQVKGE